MNDDRDDELAQLFAARERAADRQIFVARVSGAVRQERRRQRAPQLAMIAIGLCSLIVAAPYLTDIVLTLVDSTVVTTELVALRTGPSA